MPADRLRRLRGPERPTAALPALSPLPPCGGLSEVILRGAEGLRPAAAACCPWMGAPPRPAALLPGGPGDRLRLLLRPARPAALRPPLPAGSAALAPADWRSGVRTIAHLKCYLVGLHLTNYN